VSKRPPTRIAYQLKSRLHIIPFIRGRAPILVSYLVEVRNKSQNHRPSCKPLPKRPPTRYSNQSAHLHTKYQYNKSSTDVSSSNTRSVINIPIPQASKINIPECTADTSIKPTKVLKHIKSLIRSRAPKVTPELVEAQLIYQHQYPTSVP